MYVFSLFLFFVDYLEMGNCAICVKQQPTETPNRTSLISSLSDNYPRSSHRNRLSNVSTVPSFFINGLIDETLHLFEQLLIMINNHHILC